MSLVPEEKKPEKFNSSECGAQHWIMRSALGYLTRKTSDQTRCGSAGIKHLMHSKYLNASMPRESKLPQHSSRRSSASALPICIFSEHQDSTPPSGSLDTIASPQGINRPVEIYSFVYASEYHLPFPNQPPPPCRSRRITA